MSDPIERLKGEIAAASRDEIVEMIAPVLRKLITGPERAEVFRLLEEQGVHVNPVHFYEPIPDTRTFTPEMWETDSRMVGVDFKVQRQLALVAQFASYHDEMANLPHEPTGVAHEFHLLNDAFSGTDALHLYGMIRHFRPRRVIEVGSGFSSRLAAKAGLANGDGMQLTCIEPHPEPFLKEGFPGMGNLIAKRVQEVPFDFFQQLGENDILFIDSSHVSKCGSDVNYELLEVVPRLRPGVIVHVHDIFLPREFPREWMREQLLFWNEQYLLHAFLAFNADFEVVLMNNYLGTHHGDALRAALPSSNWWGGGSFWFRRKSSLPLDVANPRLAVGPF